jgi:hypothetical protein
VATKEEYANSQAGNNGKEQPNIECHGDQHQSIGYSGLDKCEKQSHNIDLKMFPSKISYRGKRKKNGQ